MLPEGTWESVDPDSVQLLAEPSQREKTTLLFANNASVPQLPPAFGGLYSELMKTVCSSSL